MGQAARQPQSETARQTIVAAAASADDDSNDSRLLPPTAAEEVRTQPRPPDVQRGRDQPGPASSPLCCSARTGRSRPRWPPRRGCRASWSACQRGSRPHPGRCPWPCRCPASCGSVDGVGAPLRCTTAVDPGLARRPSTITMRCADGGSAGRSVARADNTGETRGMQSVNVRGRGRFGPRVPLHSSRSY